MLKENRHYKTFDTVNLFDTDAVDTTSIVKALENVDFQMLIKSLPNDTYRLIAVLIQFDYSFEEIGYMMCRNKSNSKRAYDRIITLVKKRLIAAQRKRKK
jgi:DNA-directed RNA polymerase specialized sigma24 family protein